MKNTTTYTEGNTTFTITTLDKKITENRTTERVEIIRATNRSEQKMWM